MFNTSVFVSRMRGDPGFSIFDSRMRPLYSNLQFVHLKKVNFVVCEKNRKISRDTGAPSHHAWVEGFLVDAVPNHLKLNQKQLALTGGKSTIDYRGLESPGFTLKGRPNDVVEVANEVVCYKKTIIIV